MNPKLKQNIFKEIQSYKFDDDSPANKLSVCRMDEKTIQELIDKGNEGNEMAVVFLAEWLHEIKHYEEKYDQLFNNLKMYFA